MIFHAILEREPAPASRLNPDLPPKIEEIISKAIEKDPKLRYQHAADLRTDLQRLKRDSSSGRHSALTTDATSAAGIPSAERRARSPPASPPVLRGPRRLESWLFPAQFFCCSCLRLLACSTAGTFSALAWRQSLSRIQRSPV